MTTRIQNKVMAIQRFIYSSVALTLGVSIWENRSWTRINVCSGSIPLPNYSEIEHQKALLWILLLLPFFWESDAKFLSKLCCNRNGCNCCYEFSRNDSLKPLIVILDLPQQNFILVFFSFYLRGRLCPHTQEIKN